VSEAPQSREWRLQKMKERLDQLVKAEYYDQADVVSIRNMVKNNVPLAEVELLVMQSVISMRDLYSVTPHTKPLEKV
jgi:hypothetical protein